MSPLREIRAASLVDPQWWIESWTKLNIPWLVVNDDLQLMVYGCLGGAALVEKVLAEKYFATALEEWEAVHDWPVGYRDIRCLPKESLFRAPTPKLRMRVLKRDSYRCRVCGRRAFDDTDLELHVHHIVPWAVGGLTEEQNLITLCHTCHNGLSPHREFKLFSLLESSLQSPEEYVSEFREGVNRHRAMTGAPGLLAWSND